MSESQQAILESQQENKVQQSNGKYFTRAHVDEARKKQGRELPIDLEYDPKIFWDSVGEAFYKSFVKREQYQVGVPWLVDRLRVLKVETLLDCGTGFGRGRKARERNRYFRADLKICRRISFASRSGLVPAY